MTEFLYQNGAKLDSRDSRGRGCLHHAALYDDAGYVNVVAAGDID